MLKCEKELREWWKRFESLAGSVHLQRALPKSEMNRKGKEKGERIMKTLTSRVVVLTVVALCAVAAFGQTNMNLKGEIPFQFTVGDQTLSSGEYTVRNLMGRVQCLRSDEGKPVAFIANPLSYTGDGQAKLVFHRYGSELVLAEVWTAETGYQVNISKKQQTKLAKLGNYETIAMLMQPVR